MIVPSFRCHPSRDRRPLREAGIPAEADVYPGWFHAYDLFFPAKKVVREAVERFERHYQYAAAHYFAPQKE